MWELGTFKTHQYLGLPEYIFNILIFIQTWTHVYPKIKKTRSCVNCNTEISAVETDGHLGTLHSCFGSLTAPPERKPSRPSSRTLWGNNLSFTLLLSRCSYSPWREVDISHFLGKRTSLSAKSVHLQGAVFGQYTCVCMCVHVCVHVGACVCAYACSSTHTHTQCVFALWLLWVCACLNSDVTVEYVTHDSDVCILVLGLLHHAAVFGEEPHWVFPATPFPSCPSPNTQRTLGSIFPLPLPSVFSANSFSGLGI